MSFIKICKETCPKTKEFRGGVNDSFPSSRARQLYFDANMTMEYLQISAEFQISTAQSGWIVHFSDDRSPKVKCPIQNSPKSRVCQSTMGGQ
jgi:hypothetical protein